MGSLMIEENVVAEAGTVHHLTLDQIREAISELGYDPRQRNVHYQLFDSRASKQRSRRTMLSTKRFARRKPSGRRRCVRIWCRYRSCGVIARHRWRDVGR